MGYLALIIVAAAALAMVLKVRKTLRGGGCSCSGGGCGCSGGGCGCSGNHPE